MSDRIKKIAVVGAGRMGRGIALSFAFAGVPVVMVDLKERSDTERGELATAAHAEIRQDLEFLAEVKLLASDSIAAVLDQIEFTDTETAVVTLSDIMLVFEGVPEVIDAKTRTFDFISQHVPNDAIIASTTSTFLVDELAALVTNPGRFVNAHWLNPAHLMPLVEISKGKDSSEAAVLRLVTILESIGKVPVVCSASPGYIVPRIQALAMNEAARIVEEGVASAEDVDKAVRVGFGLRFAVLGLLEFIDWGGGDILYYASNYLSEAIDPRFKAPDVVVDNMQKGRNGLRDGVGFYDFSKIDVGEYRRQRLTDFVAMLKHRDLLPTEGQAK